MGENCLQDTFQTKPVGEIHLDWPPIPWWRKLAWRIRRVWEWPFDFAYKVRCFIQRGLHGWSDYDWISLDSYIAGVLVGALTRMREKGMGYPGCTGNDGAKAETYEEWQALLDEMIEGFRSIRDDEDLAVLRDGSIVLDPWGEVANDKIDHVTWAYERPEYKRAMALFSEWFPALWD